MAQTSDIHRDLVPTSSMADIAFLLLVFFILTSTLAAQRGLDFGLDSPETISIEPVASVLVEVLRDGGLRVDGQAMGRDQLLPYLQPRLAINPSKPVIVRPLATAPYGAAVEVLDLLRQGNQILGLTRPIEIALPSAREAAAWGF